MEMYGRSVLVFVVLILVFFGNIGVTAIDFNGGKRFYALDAKDMLKHDIGTSTVKGINVAGSVGRCNISSNSDVEVVLLDSLDQHQEKNTGFYKIYGDHWFAQSFVPSSDKSRLTRVEILINKHVKKSPLRARTIAAAAALRIKEVEEKKPLLDNKLGSITLEIRETLDGRPIADRTLNPDEIPKNGDGSWIVFDVPDIDLWIDHTYYIVIHASGGDESSYYRWYFASDNPYGRGMAYSSYDNATTWNNEPNNDFCFRTYGELSDELPDGKTEYWALLVGVAKYEYGSTAPYCDNDAYDFRDVLIHHDWQEDHIVVLTNEQATEKNITDALRWIDSMEDEDDIVIYFHAAHGSDHYICTYEYYGGFMSYELDAMLHWLGSKNILAIIECCYSGGWISARKFTNRVVLTSSRKNEYSWAFGALENGVFGYFLVDETGTWSKRHPSSLELMKC